MTGMGTKDWTNCFDSSPNIWKHADIFPKNIFCIVAGSTGSGKSNWMIDLLLTPNRLNYCDVYVYSPTLYQDGYVFLKKYYENIEKHIFHQTGQDVQIAHFYENDEEIIDPKTLDKNKKHVIVFDDVMLYDQKVIKKYFCTGRHNNVDVFYLVQSLFNVKKHCIRQNANMFVLFCQDDKTLKYFHESHCSGDMDFKEMKSFCDKAWEKKHGYVVINLWDEAHCGRYWLNYTDVYVPNKYYNK